MPAGKQKPRTRKKPKHNPAKVLPAMPQQPLLARNHLDRSLLLIILLINAYTFGMPFIPAISYRLHTHNIQARKSPYITRIASAQKPQAAPIPKDNRVVIPAIGLDQPIYQGWSAYTVNKGVWIRPAASTPPAGSNTVLVGHRYTYSGPSVFYELDKVSLGDKIIVYWQGKEYDYEVKTTEVVVDTDVAIEDSTSTTELTIYTCTPLWSFTDRLVLVAEPISGDATQ